MQQSHTVGHSTRVWRVDERKLKRRPELLIRHRQNDRRQIGALNLGLGELGPGVEVLFFEEPDCDTGTEAAATAAALVGRCLRYRLDWQTLDLGPLAKSRHAGFADIDDVANAGNRQRSFGHICGDDDSASFRLAEDPLLFFR